MTRFPMVRKVKKKAHHYFVPHEHNNFRSKLLHHSSIFVAVLGMFLATIVVNSVQVRRPDILGISYSITQQELLEATNRARQDRGLAPLALNPTLASAANAKAAHMISNNYWAHFAPDGTSPWSFIRSAGYGYVFAGENLAKGFTDSGSIVNAWLNSPSHRDNLLSDKYQDIGFAVVEGTLEGEDTVLVVQMFGTQDTPVVAQVQTDTLAPTPTAAPEVIPTVAQSSRSALLANPSSAPTPATATARIKESDVNYLEERTLPIEVPENTTAFLNANASNDPMINLASAARVIPFLIIFSFVLAFAIDMVVIHKKKIPRVAGHNLDHIMVLAMFLILLVLERFGSIL